MDERLFPSVSLTVGRVDGTGRRTGDATLYAYRAPGVVVLKLGMIRAVIPSDQWNRLVTGLAPPSAEIRVDWRAVAANLAANLQAGNTTAGAVALASYQAAADMADRIEEAGDAR